MLELLSEQIAGAGLPALKKQMLRGEVKVNGGRERKDVTLGCGDKVEIFLPKKFTPQNIDTVYEDDNIIIADKPARMLTEGQLEGLLSARAAHRLDRNTTGLVLLAKNDVAHCELLRAIKAHDISKFYSAQVLGELPEQSGTLEAYLVKNSESGLCKVYDEPVQSGKKIVTQYKVISFDGTCSNVELSPVTGRTHQLRAHMAHIGCPIIGDGKYGDNAANKAFGAPYQRLRAVRLKFGTLLPPLDYLSGKQFFANTVDY